MRYEVMSSIINQVGGNAGQKIAKGRSALNDIEMGSLNRSTGQILHAFLHKNVFTGDMRLMLEQLTPKYTGLFHPRTIEGMVIYLTYGTNPSLTIIMGADPQGFRGDRSTIDLGWGGKDNVSGRCNITQHKEAGKGRIANSVRLRAKYDTEGVFTEAELTVNDKILGYRVPNGPILAPDDEAVIHYASARTGNIVKQGYSPLYYPVADGTLSFPEEALISNKLIKFVLTHERERRHIIDPSSVVTRGIDVARRINLFTWQKKTQELAVPSYLDYAVIMDFLTTQNHYC